ncbi:MAG: S8 family serine peptidase, partial [Woeseia sp.]
MSRFFQLRSFVRQFAMLLATLTVFASTTSAEVVALGDVRLHPQISEAFATLPGATPYGAFVHFKQGTPADHRDLVEGHGLEILADFESSIGVVFAAGTLTELRGLTRESSIEYLEPNRPLAWYGDTGPWASRARVALEAASGGPYRNAGNNILSGDGISVAIIDSGFDGTHPDLTSRVVANYKIVCTTPGLINTNTGQCFGPLLFQDVGNSANTDLTSGHGTHVAGIVAGNGTASNGGYGSVSPNVQGTYTGVAPGASLVGYSTGEALSVLFATEAWQHIYDNYDSFSPRIKVTNNSFGEVGGATYDPNSVDAKLAKALVQDRGIVMVFAAGNEGGNGSAELTSSYCDDPTPGVICVANYNDANTGNRDNILAASSSRGISSNSATWPDVSAPGSSITSTCNNGQQPVCTSATLAWQPYYGTIGGTSMASPHVAGAVALLLEARPTMTPAEVEDVILDTARKFTAGAPYVADPQNPGQTTSFDKGAGLMDLAAALKLLGVTHDGLTGSGTPSVRITAPANGAEFDGSMMIAVGGTANDGTLPATNLPVEVLADDATDPSLPGAADIVGLAVQEQSGGMSYRITLRDAADLPAGQSVTLRVTQNVDGTNMFTNVVLGSGGASPGSATPATAVATSASVSGNVLEFFIPFANLGNPASGAPAHNVFSSSFVGPVVDLAPSPATGPGADVIARPMFARPYTLLRPGMTTAPVAEVRLSVDGGPEQATSLNGMSPAYNWSTSISPAGLADGEHTLTANLYLDGVLSTSDSSTFVIERVQTFTYDVLITAPRNGDTMPRATVEVRGTSGTDDPSTDRQVTLEVIGPDAQAETAANGTGPWSLNVDFNRAPGAYTLVARFYVDGVEHATHQINVAVPEPGQQLSCSARSKGFWKHQFDGKKNPHFTPGEAATLADRGAQLSADYFSNGSALVTALYQQGSAGAEARAARQYAALLLNLAGGELSSGMSYQAGLSGAELLDPSVYNTTV